MPECFRESGYHVEGGGKIFHHILGNNPPGIWNNYHPQVQDSSWHYDYPVPGQHAPKKGVHWPEGFPLNGIENVKLGKKPPANYREFDWGPLDKPDIEMGDGQMVQWAIDFLERSHDKPFFLAAGIYHPLSPRVLTILIPVRTPGPERRSHGNEKTQLSKDVRDGSFVTGVSYCIVARRSEKAQRSVYCH
jgi:hypothetical protein